MVRNRIGDKFMNVKEKKEKEEQGAVTSSPRLACPLLSDTVDMVEHSLARDSSQLLLSSGVVVYNLVSVLSTVQCVNCPLQVPDLRH